MNLDTWLNQKRHAHPELDLNDWRTLIQSALGISKTTQRIAPPHLSAAELTTLEHWAKRFVAGEPLAYVVGSQAFLDFEVRVNRATLIPRSDTETVALQAIAIAHDLAKRFAPLHIWDLGTGSGILAIALKRALPQAHVVAVDISAPALAVAQENAKHLGADIQFHQSAWFDALTTQRAHLIISNPPYIAPDDVHLADLTHEPQSALVAAEQGYADLFHLIDNAPNYLFSGGFLLLEHGFEQAEQIAQRFAHNPRWQAITPHHDLAQRPRATFAQWI